MDNPKTAVIALGGNAISPKGVDDTITNQFSNTRKSLKAIMNLVREDYRLAITHGNGPQVGNALLRVELSHGKAPFLPLGICVADTEGGMGYMIEQSLQNALIQSGINRDVVTIVTQVIVDYDDPALKNPQKFIGSWYTEEEILPLAREYGWQIREITGKGWRRVVPSPIPQQIINRKSIKHLFDIGTIVITAGGGGIPVYKMNNEIYEGVDAVIDKDMASAVLARDIHAEEFYILTEVDHVYLNFGTSQQQAIDIIHAAEIMDFYEKGYFPPGSMGPKILAAVNFLENGGKTVVITSLDQAIENLSPNSGTTILP